MKKLLLACFVLSIISISHLACARNAEGEADEWNPVAAGPITTWTAPLCGKNECVVQPFFFYNRTRGLFDSDGHYN